MPSTAPSATASSAGDERASRTVETAHSTFRSRALAIEVILAMASFMTLSPSVPGMSVPSPLMGDAAPMLVPGAMRAMFPESVMNVPALAAKPPAGATQTMTGMRASRRVPTMSLVAVSSPPGVLSLITTAAAPRCSALAIESARYLAMV